jgi:hypothetical protein
MYNPVRCMQRIKQEHTHLYVDVGRALIHQNTALLQFALVMRVSRPILVSRHLARPQTTLTRTPHRKVVTRAVVGSLARTPARDPSRKQSVFMTISDHQRAD